MINIVFIGNIINYTALFITAAAGSSISLKCGDLNLGGEGQIYLGGFLSAIVLGAFSNTFLAANHFIAIFGILIALLISFCGSALVALFSAFLKQFNKTDFLLSSFICSAAICPLIDGLISGPFRSTSGNLLATAFINKNFRFTKFFLPSSINLFILIAIILCILMWIFLYKTPIGKQITIYGKAKEFSLYKGDSEKKISYISSILSGGLHGLTGAAAIIGMYYSCFSGFSNGIGWSALTVALIAKANPLLVIPTSLFMSILINTSTQYALFNNFDFDLSTIIQGIVLFIISIPFVKRSKLN